MGILIEWYIGLNVYEIDIQEFRILVSQIVSIWRKTNLGRLQTTSSMT